MIANVAVVITTWNRAAQLTRCLWSIFEHGQVKPRVAVIVDDGSEDNTSEVLEQLARVYPIKWMRRERQTRGWQSPVLPRNMAIRMALRENPEFIVLTEPEMLVMGDTLDKALAYYVGEGGRCAVNASAQCFVGAPFLDEEWRNPEAVYGAPESKVTRKFNETAVRFGLFPAEVMRVTRGYDEWFGGGVADEVGRVAGEFGYWGYDDVWFITCVQNLGYRILNKNEVQVVHQWHAPPPAIGHLADVNLAHMQMLAEQKKFVVNDETWGTDSGRYPWLATNPE